MKTFPETIPIERYSAIDLHKEYVMVGGKNEQQEWTLRPRRVQMSRFRDWAQKNLKPGDAVVIETTCNVWDIYDIVAPLIMINLRSTGNENWPSVLWAKSANPFTIAKPDEARPTLRFLLASRIVCPVSIVQNVLEQKVLDVP
jgi:hypothetical protein